MKKYIIALFITILATACTKEQAIPDNNESHPMNVEIICSNAAVKTSIYEDEGKYLPAWVSSDAIGVYTVFNATENNTNKRFTITSLTGDRADAFAGTADNSGAGDYTFFGYYPFTDGQVSGSHPNVRLALLSLQYPSLTSFDGDADVLVSKPVTRYITAEQSELNDLNFQFARLVSILKINLKNIDAAIASEKVTSVRISAPSYILSGNFSLNLAEGTTSDWSGNDFVQANYTSSAAADGFTSWINVNPVCISAGKEFIVRVATESHILQKNIVLTKDLNMREGTIVSITVDLSGCQINPQPTKPSGINLLGIVLGQDSDGFNMLSDGGFENFSAESTTYWKDHSLWYVPDYVWAYDDADIKSGKRSLYADLNTHDWRDVIIQTVALKKNTAYAFSIDMKKAWADAGVFFGFRASEVHDYNTNTTDTADWKTYTYEWTDDSDVQANMFVGAWPWDNFWIRLDNLKLVPKDYERPSYKPVSTSVEPNFNNNTFQKLDDAVRMVLWPIGNPETSTSYGIALSNAKLDGVPVETVYASATANENGLVIDSFAGNGSVMLSSNEGAHTVVTSGFSSLDGGVQYAFYYTTDDDYLANDDFTVKGSYVAKSVDGGRTWTKIESLSRDASSKFVNTAAMVVDETVYVYGTPAGRGGVATYLAKVPLTSFENLSSWRYYDGGSFDATTETGAVSIFYGPTSEISVCFNPGTSNYIALYRSRTTGKLVYREAQYPEGIWSGEKEAVADPDGGCYCAPSIVRYPSGTGNKVFVTVSNIQNGYTLGGTL